MKQKSVQDVDMLGHFGKQTFAIGSEQPSDNLHAQRGSPGGKEFGNEDCSWERRRDFSSRDAK